mgnify:CR=1 FL=1|jgi:hypothetical protein
MNKINKDDYKYCFLSFSFDERVRLEDISRIPLMARKYPHASLYSCDKYWNEECQIFCLAHSRKEAKIMFDRTYPIDQEGGVPIDDFWTDEIQSNR